MMRHYWWKILACVLILYSIIGGMLIPVPQMNVVGESIRNLFYHVPMWFAMIAMLTVSVIFSIRFLKNQQHSDDLVANSAVSIALFFGFTGIITGMLWARFTWGSVWVNDPKLNGAALGILIYLAYRILRGAIADPLQKAKIAAVFNIFAFTLFIVFVFVLPKVTASSIHPGAKDSMVFSPASLDNALRMVFYPAMLGWILFAGWMLEVYVRIYKYKREP